LSVFIGEEGNTCRTVRVVFDRCDLRGNAVLGPLEIDHTVHFFVAAADVPHGPSAVNVPSSCFLQRCEQGFLRHLSGYLVKCTRDLMSLAWCYRLDLSDCHIILNVAVKIYGLSLGESDNSLFR